ncbi:unnamed protein product [Lathyrus sativus]|nr:unnamed protein product [Lathyrus sativus]
MGIIFGTSSNNISKIEVYKSPSGNDQTIVYSTSLSRTCTLRAAFGVQTAYFSLMDSLTTLGFRVDFMVRHEGCIRPIDFRIGGRVLDIRNEPNNLCIQYGIPNYNLGILVANKNPTSTGGETLLVFHMLLSASELCLGGWHVWHDVWKGRFVCESIGPFRRSSFSEIMIDMENARNPFFSNAASSTCRDQTSITGLINNLGGPVLGHLNGSIINNIINNYFSK